MLKTKIYINTEEPSYSDMLHVLFKKTYGTQIKTTPLKYDKKAVLYKVMFNDQIFVVKHYPHTSFLYQLRSSRAHRCYQFAKQLKKLGIRTPSPIALVEEHVGPLRHHSYFITEYVESNQAYDYFVADNEDTHTLKAKIIKQLTALKNHGLLHNDLKLVNIIVDRNLKPYLIDLDAMRKRRPLLDDPLKDLKRFEREIISSTHKHAHHADL